jgi:hypothetical protein
VHRPREDRADQVRMEAKGEPLLRRRGACGHPIGR